MCKVQIGALALTPYGVGYIRLRAHEKDLRFLGNLLEGGKGIDPVQPSL